MEYFLTRKNVKNVNLRICADGSVRVSANPRVAVSRTDAFVREKGEWVLHKKEEFARRAAQKNKMTVCNGAKTLFLGREYVLRIIAAEKKSVSISEDGGEIEIRIPDTADLQVAEKRWKGGTPHVRRKFCPNCSVPPNAKRKGISARRAFCGCAG